MRPRLVVAAAAVVVPVLLLLVVSSFPYRPFGSDTSSSSVQPILDLPRLPSPLNASALYEPPPSEYRLKVFSCDPTKRNRHTYQTHLDASTPVPPITMGQLKDAMTCWSTQGTFKQDNTSCLYATEDYVYKGIPYDCKHIKDRLKTSSRYWAPDPDCGPRLPFRHLDGMELCHTMRGRNMLIVGDSLSAQHYFDFLALTQRSLILHGGPGAQHVLQTTPWKTNAFRSVSFPITYAQTHGICEGTGYSNFSLTFVRNDYISIVDEVCEDIHHIQYLWHPHLSNNSIVILNTGLHYRDDSTLIAAYNATLNYLEGNFLDRNDTSKLVILRNTSPGNKLIILFC